MQGRESSRGPSGEQAARADPHPSPASTRSCFSSSQGLSHGLGAGHDIPVGQPTPPPQSESLSFMRFAELVLPLACPPPPPSAGRAALRCCGMSRAEAEPPARTSGSSSKRRRAVHRHWAAWVAAAPGSVMGHLVPWEVLGH